MIIIFTKWDTITEQWGIVSAFMFIKRLSVNVKYLCNSFTKST